MFLESEKRLIHVLKAVAVYSCESTMVNKLFRELSSCWMDTLTRLNVNLTWTLFTF